jgi:HKD family nuclease
MNILTTPDEIENKICSLMNSYKTISFASAWASGNSKAFQTLLKNIDKVKKIVVGIHFYQTNPNFIKEFIDNDKVKFITNPSGIFHPKIYLFINNNNDWECLVGSANFTKSAFEKNSEILINISNDDVNSKEVFNTLINEINEFHKKADKFTSEDLDAYQIIWDKKAKNILDLQDKFSKKENNKPIYKSKIITLDWNDYYNKVKKDRSHSFDIRLKILEKAKKYFKNNTYKNMTDLERKHIAGIAKNDEEDNALDWMYFGNMVNPRFKTRINNDYADISKALDYIPLNGNVTKDDYMNYIEYFERNKGYGYGVSTISRLLAMKRPDVFFCITGGNKKYLYKDFGIKKNEDIKSNDYERYWDEIIQRIHKSSWYNTLEPTNSEEKKLWLNRVAMLDAIFYSDGL